MTIGSQLPQPTASGTLAKTPLPHLLVYVLEKQLTGSMDLLAPDGERATILVLEGFPSKARTSEATSYLGHVLLEAGFITEDQLNASMAYYRPGQGKLHGQVLVEMGVLDEPRLLEGLRRQVVHKIEHLFNWPPETRFAYYDAFDALADYGADDMVTVDPLPLVWASIKQTPSWEHVHATLSRVGSAPLRLLPDAAVERLELAPDERQFVELMRPTPRRLYEMTSGGTIGPSAKQLLVYCLLITKQLEVIADDAQSSARRSAPMPAPAAPQSAVARVQLQPRQISKPAGAVQESRAPGVRRRDDRSSSPTLTPVPPNAREAADGEDSPEPPTVAAPIETPSAATSSPNVSSELGEQRKKILRRAEEITRQDYYQMLGVSRDATTDEVQKAYFLLAKVWHPDRLPSALKEVRDACSKVFAHLSEAHQTLTDAERRNHYMMLIKDGGATPDDQAVIVSVLEAATNFQKAEICMKRNDLVQAEQLVRAAHKSDPKQADYLALLTWIESTKSDSQSIEKTNAHIATLDQALKMNDKCERAYFYRGMLNKRAGNERAAYKDFKQASELNPRNIDATREVRLYTMRKGTTSSMPPGQVPASTRPGKKPEPGGIFGKLFKK